MPPSGSKSLDSKQNSSTPTPPKTRRHMLIGLSALLALAALLLSTGPKNNFPALDKNPIAQSMVEVARIRGVRPSVVAVYAAQAKGGPAERESDITAFISSLDIATKATRGAGIITPSDRLLLEVTMIVQDGLDAESISHLLSSWDSSVRLRRIARYRQLRQTGLPPSSAATQAAIIR